MPHFYLFIVDTFATSPLLFVAVTSYAIVHQRSAPTPLSLLNQVDIMHLSLPSALSVLLASSATAFAPSYLLPSTGRCGRPSCTAIITTRARTNKDEEGGGDLTESKAGVNPAKRAALDGVMQRIERNYGRGSIVKLGDADRMIVECIGSGSLTLGEYIFIIVSSLVD